MNKERDNFREHSLSVGEIYKELASHIPARSDLQMKDVECVLRNTIKINKGAFQSLILRAAAVILDAKYYNNNIKHCSYVYIVNTLGGKIDVVPTKGLSKNSWQYFAAFRTQEDAILAVKMFKVFKDYYANK